MEGTFEYLLAELNSMESGVDLAKTNKAVTLGDFMVEGKDDIDILLSLSYQTFNLDLIKSPSQSV